MASGRGKKGRTSAPEDYPKGWAFRFEGVKAWLEEHLGTLEGDDLNLAHQMWDRGSHPVAIYDAINKQRDSA